MKKCTKCKLPKDESEFAFKSKELQTLHAECKICSSARHRAIYAANREKQSARSNVKNKIKREKLAPINKKLMLEYLKEHPCECGETRPMCLDFDHRDQKTKKYMIAHMLQDYEWSKIIVEIDKCDVRCANCHRVRTSKQLNWWYEQYK